MHHISCKQVNLKLKIMRTMLFRRYQSNITVADSVIINS